MSRVLQPDARRILRRKARTKVYSFHLLSRQAEMLGNIRDNLGISVAEQIRRGIDLWLKQKETG